MKSAFLKQLAAMTLSLATLALLTGCFETKQEFTLNPDGSGKVVHESSFQNINLSGDDDTSEASLKEAVVKVMEGAKGVEAWRDVSYKRLDDGRLHFKGTAYFKNLSQLEIPNQTMLEFDWKKSADTGVLTLRTNKSDGGRGLKIEKKPVDLTKLSPEERAKKIAEERAKFQQTRPMLSGILGSMKHEAVFHLPGKPGAQSNLTSGGNGTLQITFDGSKMIAAMEKLAGDDAWVGRNLGSLNGAGDKPTMDPDINAIVFGSKAPVSATVTGMRAALFNYETEVAAAKKEYAKLQKQLGAAGITIAPPAQGQPLKSIKVVGVRLVRESDKQRDLRPFNYETGYALSLLAELPGSVLAVTDKSGLDSAIADDGSDLLPDSEWNRRFSFPKLSKDRTAVLLEATLQLPGAGVKGLKELSGHLQYSVAGSAKEIDLGFTELKADARGTQLGAEIKSIQEGWNKDGSEQMQIKLNTSKDSLKALYLVTGDTKTELSQNGYGGGGNTYTFTYQSRTAFPANGRLVAELYDEVKLFDVPLVLENISLLGTPMAAGK
jgi:hypothetical protein